MPDLAAPPDLAKFLRKSIETASAMLLDDVRAMPHALLDANPGGKGRAPYDYLYEIVAINDRLVVTIGGGDAGPWPFEGFAVAPAAFRTPETAVAELERSGAAVLAALDSVPADEWTKEVPTTSGSTTTTLERAHFLALHMHYHDGQLNLAQAIAGDEEVHWK